MTHYQDAISALDRAGRAEIGEGYESYLLGVAQAKATLALVDGIAELAAELYRARVALELLAGEAWDRDQARRRGDIEAGLDRVVEGEKVDQGDGPVVVTVADLAGPLIEWEPAAKRWPIDKETT